MRPSNAEIVRHHHDDPPPHGDPFLPGHRLEPYQIQVVEYDDGWPAAYAQVESLVRDALGEAALDLHHIGSTSVPGLRAKPIIDVDLVVADPTDEDAYVPALVTAGFTHRIREPWWHEHRLLVLDQPITTLHVFGPDCPEVIRHRMFREWLLDHPDELRRYAEAKLTAARATNEVGGHGMDYNRHKEPVVRAIYDRMFRAHGLLD
ncbi:MAG: GrpB family protein [Nocardioides sp.]